MSLNEHVVRRHCRELVRKLGLARPIDPVELVRRLSALRGRPLLLEPRSLPTPGAFGLVVPFPDVDVIVYAENIAPEYQVQILYHEVMHLCLGHLDGAAHGGGSLLCRGHVPVSVEGRPSVYQEREEWEAETAATILSGWSSGAVVADRTVACAFADDAIARVLGARRRVS